MWNDPVWLCWQIEHQKIGDPLAYSIWLMGYISITMRNRLLPAIIALSKATVAAGVSAQRFNNLLSKVGETPC